MAAHASRQFGESPFSSFDVLRGKAEILRRTTFSVWSRSFPTTAISTMLVFAFGITPVTTPVIGFTLTPRAGRVMRNFTGRQESSTSISCRNQSPACTLMDVSGGDTSTGGRQSAMFLKRAV